LAAANRLRESESAFEQALALDPGLGDAWLGRGLCRIRQGRPQEGLDDLEVAASMEPQRAFLRSYLAKGFAQTGTAERVNHELDLARRLDPHDPTPWLYGALWQQMNNRINSGIDELERSKTENDNRRVYRSRQLLDQDLAVRSANLASLYRDAGFIDLSRREAVDAVNTDYANFSAHLFLANT